MAAVQASKRCGAPGRQAGLNYTARLAIASSPSPIPALLEHSPPRRRLLFTCPSTHADRPVQNQDYGASTAEVPRDSVYVIGMNAGGTLVATGSTQVRDREKGTLAGLLCMLGGTDEGLNAAGVPDAWPCFQALR